MTIKFWLFQPVDHFRSQGESVIEKMWFSQEKNEEKTHSLDNFFIPWDTINIAQGMEV